MNGNKRTIMVLTFLCTMFSYSQAQTNQAFFEKIEAIKKDLYKMTTHELCTILNISDETVPTITADQLKHEMNINNNLLVINVLTERYYNDCHIKGSINAPLKELVARAQSWDHTQKIVVYCALDECDAGEKGCVLLQCMGFTNVIDYRGGIKEWYQLNYPTEGPALSEYLHTKSLLSHDEYALYPETIVCSRQTRWINKYQQ